MKKFSKLLFLIIFFFILAPITEAKQVTINLFYSETCPHCAKEKEFLEQYQKENNNINVSLYEVTKNEENSLLLDNVKKSLNCENNYVPYTVIGEVGLTGFSDNIESQIKHFSSKYQNEDYIDVVEEVKQKKDVINLDDYVEKVEEKTLTLPFLGQIDAQKVSLPLIAMIIGFVDGFNPCAMWILIFLISMLLGSKDKFRRIYLGVIFLITSAFVYMLFTGAWLTVMVSAVQINFIKIIIGIVALIGAIWNLYSFYKSTKKDVGCEVVNNDKRKKIISKIKKFTNEKSLILATIGMISLAISVNVVEFACSAGWPVVFTEILALNNLTKSAYFLYILIYIVFYMLDDIIIFIIAMVTLEVTGISNKYNKYSHLIGGIMMLIIGLLMILKPDWLMMNF